MFEKKIFTLIIAIISSIISGIAGINFSKTNPDPTTVSSESIIKDKMDLIESKIDYLSMSTEFKLGIMSGKIDRLKDSMEAKEK